MFTAIVLALVIILAARAKLVSSGDVSIEINGERTITVPAGGKLLQTLAANNIFLVRLWRRRYLRAVQVHRRERWRRDAAHRGVALHPS